MKYGIYYAYWEHQWGGVFVPYVQKVKKLGFDILEVACGEFDKQNDDYFVQLGKAAKDSDIILTGGYGPIAAHNIASADPKTVENAFEFYKNIFRKMDIANIRSIGGAIYHYWPLEKNKPLDKEGDLARSIIGMQKLADIAAGYGITINMEVLNRFEGLLLNQCYEAVDYIKAVDRPNAKIMLDTFHMNIEEDSMGGAIELAGDLLGHVHVGEANRKPPFAGGRMPWKEMGDALHKIGYDGNIVMEPFVLMGGQVGHDVGIWRDISRGATPSQLDQDVADSVKFLRELWG